MAYIVRYCFLFCFVLIEYRNLVSDIPRIDVPKMTHQENLQLK